MPNQTAQVGDTVQFRNAAGETRNAEVLQTQPAAPGAGVWSVANADEGGELTDATYSYKIAAVQNGVESAPSAAKTTVVPEGTETNLVTITLPTPATGVTYKVYGRTDAAWELIGTTTDEDETFDDTGEVTPDGEVATADGRVGLFSPTGGLTNGALDGTAVKATGMKDVNAYFKRY